MEISRFGLKKVRCVSIWIPRVESFGVMADARKKEVGEMSEIRWKRRIDVVKSKPNYQVYLKTVNKQDRKGVYKWSIHPQTPEPNISRAKQT
jgi:hypothetical protein